MSKRTPRIVKVGKRRYVQVGKKRIRVSSKISERELIKWMIKYLYPKRRAVRRSAVEKRTRSDEGFSHVSYPQIDPQARDKLSQQATQLALLEHKVNQQQNVRVLPQGEEMVPMSAIKKGAERVHQVLIEQDNEIQRKKAEVAKLRDERSAIANDLKQLTADADLDLQQKEAQMALLQDEKAKIDQELRQAKAELQEIQEDQEKLQNRHEAVKRRTVDMINKDIQRLKAEMESQYWAALFAKWPYNELRTKVAKEGVKLPTANPSHRQLLEAMTGLEKNLLKEDKVWERLSNEYDPQITELELEREELLQGRGKISRCEILNDDGLTDNFQLDTAMKDYPQYLGTVTADEMFTLLSKVGQKKQVCFILNTDNRGSPGTHWIAFHIDARPEGDHSVEYYDPLANPISKGWLEQLKAFVRLMHGSDSYLKFRENKIADQGDSNNCGPFCVRFLQARLKGESFAKATGWNKKGEKNIELWKKHPKQQMWISGQTGEGLRDIWDTVRKGATRVIERIRQTIGATQNGVTRASPQVRGWLEKYGSLQIKSITVCKKPVYSMIETVMNWLSLGKLRENMDKLGYDRLMHLYMIIELEGGPTIKLEKNQVVTIKSSTDKGKQSMPVPGENGQNGRSSFTTVSDMLQKAEKQHGNKLWQYDAKTQNCQFFTVWFLGHVPADIKAFVMQDATKTLEGMGLLEKAARAVTDAAAVADVAMNGAGNTQQRACPLPPSDVAIEGAGWDPVTKKVIGVI